MKRTSCVLTIAGSDSGAGAGVQADARTIHAQGGYALTAITAITAQNTRGVRRWRPVRADLVREQIDAVLSDFKVAAIKTGLLPGASAVRAVVETLKKFPAVPLVVDPVISSTSGTVFLPAAGLRVLKSELLPRATLVTPNWPEAEALSGIAVGDVGGAEEAGREVLKTGCAAVLVKGGHGPGRSCIDLLVMRDEREAVLVRRFEGARLMTKNTHGTGCVLSAAIARELGRGATVVEAVERARAFLREALVTGKRGRWGGGAGPAFAGV